MKIYVLHYENGKRDAMEIESTKARFIRHIFRSSILYYGRLYCGDFIFNNRESALNAWNKRCCPDALNPAEIDWKLEVECI